VAQRITRFSVAQTAKMVGVLYALVGVLLAPFFLLASLAAPNAGMPGGLFAVALPVLYGVGGFVATAIGCFVYNLVAGWVGGIEVELETDASSRGPVARI
jgi:hypothetical protein